MTEFTPGPWQIERARNDPYGPIFRLIGNTPDKWQGRNGTIGSLHMNDTFSCDWTFPKDKNGEMTYDENGEVISYNRAALPAEANARLIAAAPDMFAMLQDILKGKDVSIQEFLDTITKSEEDIPIYEPSKYEIY